MSSIVPGCDYFDPVDGMRCQYFDPVHFNPPGRAPWKVSERDLSRRARVCNACAVALFLFALYDKLSQITPFSLSRLYTHVVALPRAVIVGCVLKAGVYGAVGLVLLSLVKRLDAFIAREFLLFQEEDAKKWEQIRQKSEEEDKRFEAVVTRGGGSFFNDVLKKATRGEQLPCWVTMAGETDTSKWLNQFSNEFPAESEQRGISPIYHIENWLCNLKKTLDPSSSKEKAASVLRILSYAVESGNALFKQGFIKCLALRQNKQTYPSDLAEELLWEFSFLKEVDALMKSQANFPLKRQVRGFLVGQEQQERCIDLLKSSPLAEQLMLQDEEFYTAFWEKSARFMMQLAGDSRCDPSTFPNKNLNAFYTKTYVPVMQQFKEQWLREAWELEERSLGESFVNAYKSKSAENLTGQWPEN